MATYTKVRVHFKARKGRKARTATFKKKGSRKYLCTPRRIKVGRKTILARPGGRAICGPSTGKNTAAAKANRARFKKAGRGCPRSPKARARCVAKKLG